MLFSRLVVAAVALSVAAAVPVPCETEEHNASKTVDAQSSSHAQLVAKPTSNSKAPPAPPKKAAPPAPPKQAAPPAPPKNAAPAPPKKAPPPPNNAKSNNGKGSQKAPPPPPSPPAKNNNNNKGKSTSSVNKASGSKTSSSVAASQTTPPPNQAVGLPPPKNTATDSGVAGVIEGCVNPDGVTECFEILNVLGSCFSIPNPLANHVGFFLPPPAVAGVPNLCTLFTDEDCQDGGVAGAGQVSQAGQNSFICNATSTADTTTTTTTTTTSDAASNTAVGLPPPKNTATDSGVTGVIEGCLNPDGVTNCFQILNVLGSCFSIPRPLANDVGFFLPPPAVAGVPNVCTLFTDEDCQDGAVVGAGQVTAPGLNSFICNATTTAA